MRFINLVLQLIFVNCVINTNQYKYKTYYLIENSYAGCFPYSKICKEFDIPQVNINFLTEDQTGKIEIWKIQGENEYRGYFFNTEIGSYKNTKQRINQKTFLTTLGPNFELIKEGDKLLAIRSDFLQNNLPEVLEGIALIHWIFDSTSKTVNLIDGILIDLKYKKGIYEKLKTNEYLLLFFKNDFNLIYDFFSSFRTLFYKEDKYLIFKNLCKELCRCPPNSRNTLSRIYMDINNILSLADNPEYSFEIYNINNPGDTLKVEKSVIITINSNDKYINNRIILLDSQGNELPILFLEKNEETVKLILNLEEINHKLVTIAYKDGMKIAELNIEEIRSSFN